MALNTHLRVRVLVEGNTEGETDTEFFGLDRLVEGDLAQSVLDLVSSNSFQGAVHGLARLPADQYDQVREPEAKRLGVRLSTLDSEVAKAGGTNKSGSEQQPGLLFSDPEPWPNPVCGIDLLDELVAAFERYIVLPVGGPEALALWTVMTYVHEALEVSPILALESPEKRCGKTTALSLLNALVARPLPAGNVSPAAVFRVIERDRPTLLIDEADYLLRDNEALRSILNSGHTPTVAYVLRTVGDDHEPRKFSTWAPKAIALIGSLPGTVRDRAIVLPMRRKRPDENVERLRLGSLQDDLKSLRRKCARWALDHLDALHSTDTQVLDGLNDRAADNWTGPLAIAHLAGDVWMTRVRQTALALSGDEATGADSVGVDLLSDLSALFIERGTDRLTSVDICEWLAVMESRPWPEWRAGKSITPRQLARLLTPFDIQPRTIRAERGTAKGYHVGQFEDAFARYLPFDPSQRHSPLETQVEGAFQFVTSTSAVTDLKRTKPVGNSQCDGVTHESHRTQLDETTTPSTGER